jgi:Carboxylesterase family
LALTYKKKGLYKNGISMSGTATAPWALVDNAREKGLKFASSIGCSIHNGTEHIMECLKQRPAERLLRAVGQFLVS